MLQVRKENSSWMATGAPARALIRCGGSARMNQARAAGNGEADLGRLWAASLTSQNSWVSCSTRGSMELRTPSSRAERVSLLWAFQSRE